MVGFRNAVHMKEYRNGGPTRQLEAEKRAERARSLNKMGLRQAGVVPFRDNG